MTASVGRVLSTLGGIFSASLWKLSHGSLSVYAISKCCRSICLKHNLVDDIWMTLAVEGQSVTNVAVEFKNACIIVSRIRTAFQTQEQSREFSRSCSGASTGRDDQYSFKGKRKQTAGKTVRYILQSTG
ncbi:hypothetical protein TNCV_2661181 [Trichonephila clavipes]|nr:hypothetical protein TNCV_2661181 [Trichonephila clavipes]